MSTGNNPWLPYLVTDYIKQLKPQRVFEWGSGESTLFFRAMSIRQIVSIEHDAEWYNKVSGQLPPRIDAFRYLFIPYEQDTVGSSPANPIHYKSASTELGEVNFKKYASVIDEYDKFDLILIDGMARASCLYHAASHIAENGCIILDNAERDYYMQNVAFLFEGWERILFEGYGPILDYQWKTLVLINKRKSHHE